MCSSYFENMDRLCSENFHPTQTDVLRARVRTQGVIETCFKMKDIIFRYVQDVGLCPSASMLTW